MAAGLAVLAGPARAAEDSVSIDGVDGLAERVGAVLATFSPEVDFRDWAVRWVFGLDPDEWCWRLLPQRQAAPQLASPEDRWTDLLAVSGGPGEPAQYCFPRDLFALGPAVRPTRGSGASTQQQPQLQLFGPIRPARSLPVAVPEPETELEAVPRAVPAHGATGDQEPPPEADAMPAPVTAEP